MENPTRIEKVIQETVKKSPKSTHFSKLPRHLSTTHQHKSRTIVCGKDVSYMHAQTCKAALASCFI
jgi:phosphoheptose isomerase